MSIFNIIRNDKKCDEELMKEVKDIRDELKGVLSILSNSGGVKPIVGNELESGVTKTTNNAQTDNIPRLNAGLAAQIRKGGGNLKKTPIEKPKETPTLLGQIQEGGKLNKTGGLERLIKNEPLNPPSEKEKKPFEKELEAEIQKRERSNAKKNLSF